MTNYYIEQGNKIVLFDTIRQKLIDTLSFMPQYQHLTVNETERPIVDFQFADTEENKVFQEEREQDRINHLTMTALDLIKLLQTFGLSLPVIQGYLDANPELQIQLTYCKDVYCGVVRQLCPVTVEGITITDEMIVQAFKEKNKQK